MEVHWESGGRYPNGQRLNNVLRKISISLHIVYLISLSKQTCSLL